jgi:hypothetical protein
MVQRMRDHIILAFRTVAISRLKVAQAEKDLVYGFFENVLHGCRRLAAARYATGSLSRRPGRSEVRETPTQERKNVTRLTTPTLSADDAP